MNEQVKAADEARIEYTISVLSEMKHSLDRLGVVQTYTRNAIINTSANLCGNYHDYVCWKVLGIPMVEDGEARI